MISSCPREREVRMGDVLTDVFKKRGNELRMHHSRTYVSRNISGETERSVCWHLSLESTYRVSRVGTLSTF